MPKKKTNFIWIVLVILGLFLLGSQMGMFSTVCTSSEPDTLEGYETMEDFVIHHCIVDDRGDCFYEGCSEGVAEFSITETPYQICPFPVFVDGPDILLQNMSEFVEYNSLIQNSTINEVRIYGEVLKLFESNGRLISTDNPQPYFDTFYTCEEEPGEDKCVTTISGFCVELWMILVAIGGLFFLIILKR